MAEEEPEVNAAAAAVPAAAALAEKWRGITYISMFVGAVFLYATMTMTYTEFWCVDTYGGWGWILLGSIEAAAAVAALYVSTRTGASEETTRMTRNAWILLGAQGVFSIVYGFKFAKVWTCNWFGIYDIMFCGIAIISFVYAHARAAATRTSVMILLGVACVYTTLSMDQVEYFCGAARNATGAVVVSKTAGHFPATTWNLVGVTEFSVGIVMLVFSTAARYNSASARASAMCVFSACVALQGIETLVYVDSFWETSGADWFSIADIAVAGFGVLCVLYTGLCATGMITEAHRNAHAACWQWLTQKLSLCYSAIHDRIHKKDVSAT
jgi:hypothetical protein